MDILVSYVELRIATNTILPGWSSIGLVHGTMHSHADSQLVLDEAGYNFIHVERESRNILNITKDLGIKRGDWGVVSLVLRQYNQDRNQVTSFSEKDKSIYFSSCGIYRYFLATLYFSIWSCEVPWKVEKRP